MVFRLREILKERQITIGQFSQICGISQSNLSNYMMGKVSPTLETLEKIAKALDIELADLFQKEEEIVLMAKYNEQLFPIRKKDLINYIKANIKGNE